MEPRRPRAQADIEMTDHREGGVLVLDEKATRRTYNSLSGVKHEVHREKSPSYSMGNVRPGAMPSRKLAEAYQESNAEREGYALPTGSLCLNAMRATERPKHLKEVINLAHL